MSALAVIILTLLNELFRCLAQKKATNFDQRVETRNGELKALSEAIAKLSVGVSNYGANKKLALSQQAPVEEQASVDTTEQNVETSDSSGTVGESPDFSDVDVPSDDSEEVDAESNVLLGRVETF